MIRFFFFYINALIFKGRDFNNLKFDCEISKLWVEI
jgi:hypothetical protein